MSDLQQISLCLKQVSGHSLVLIDEFGKGTNESGELQSSYTRTLIYTSTRMVTQFIRWNWTGLWGT
jgi:dsDNA-specific endonuclease/ATPase MutS2